MITRIKAGAITEFHGNYSRYICIVCDNGMIFQEPLHSKNKEDLYIVDDER